MRPVERPTRWTDGCLALIAATALLMGCGDDAGEIASTDTTPPGVIADLSTIDSSSTTITLTWTAVGDDVLGSGAATSYDVRFSRGGQRWDEMEMLASPLSPALPGAAETLTVGSLRPSTGYCFLIQSKDAVGNLSTISNAACGQTLPLAGADDNWWSGFDALGLDDGIVAMQTIDDRLFVSGSFDRAGELPARGLAAFDGDAWEPVEPSPGGWEVLGVHLGSLVLGGPRILRSSGTSWERLGELDGRLHALLERDGTLLAGGELFDPDAVTDARAVWAWDESTWRPIGELTGDAYALAVYNDMLIAAGHLDLPDSVDSSRLNIAAWNGENWAWISDDSSGVFSLTVHQDRLIAVTCDGVRAWDGSLWTDLARLSCIDARVMVHRDDLVLIGRFQYAGTTVANGVARWDGSDWSAFGSGIAGEVYAAATLGGDLYVGGYFEIAGGKPSRYIARWIEP